MDTGEITFLAAYDLSFIKNGDRQRQIAELMESDNYKVDMKKAELLRSNGVPDSYLADITLPVFSEKCYDRFPLLSQDKMTLQFMVSMGINKSFLTKAASPIA